MVMTRILECGDLCRHSVKVHRVLQSAKSMINHNQIQNGLANNTLHTSSVAVSDGPLHLRNNRVNRVEKNATSYRTMSSGMLTSSRLKRLIATERSKHIQNNNNKSNDS